MFDSKLTILVTALAVSAANSALAYSCQFSLECIGDSECTATSLVADVQLVEQRFVFKQETYPISFMNVSKSEILMIARTQEIELTLGTYPEDELMDYQAVLSISDPNDIEVIYAGYFGECEEKL